MRSSRGGAWRSVGLIGVLLVGVFAASLPARAFSPGVSNTSTPSVSNLSPNGGEVLVGGGQTTISWTQSHGTDLSLRATIRYSLDGGGTYPYFITSEVFPAGDAAHRWNVPVVTRDQVRIRVCAVAWDYDRACIASTANFRINASAPWLSALSPADGAFNVSIDEPIYVSALDIDPVTMTYSILPYIPLGYAWTGNNTSLTFSHSTMFQMCTQYDVEVNGRDTSGGSHNLTWSFMTQCQGPYILFTSPMNNSLNVPVTAPLIVGFSHRMDPVTVTLTLVRGFVVSLSYSWTQNDTLLTATHATPFGLGMLYTVQVWGHDVFGDALIGPPPNQWSFTTGPASGPFITQTNPADGETNVPVWWDINIQFSEAMDQNSLNWSIVPFISLYDVWLSDMEVNLTQSNATFQTCTQYTIQIWAYSLPGEPLIPGPVPNPWIFTTTCPNPIILFTDPFDGEYGVELDRPIVVIFSQPMNRQTVILFVSPSLTVNESWSNNDTYVTYTHSPFLSCVTYILEVYGEDTSGNPLVPGPVPNPWFFLTACGNPYITDTDPYAGEVDVALGASISIGFNEPMDQGSLLWSISPFVDLNASWDPGGNTSRVTLTQTGPAPSFEPCTAYTVQVWANDTEGNPLVSGPVPNPWTFTTLCGQPYVVYTNPVDGATGVLRDADIVVVFSEPMDAPSVGVDVAPSVSGLNLGWTAPDVLTVTHDPFSPCRTYQVLVTGMDPDGLPLVPGPVPNPWSFTVSCAVVSIELLSPVGGESWTGGSPHSVQFRITNGLPSGQAVAVNATYRYAAGSSSGAVGTQTVSVPAGATINGQFPWTVPLLDAADVIVNLTGVATPSGDAMWDESGNFTIDSTPPSVLSATPNGTHIPPNPTLVVLFSEEMMIPTGDPFSITPAVPHTPMWTALDRLEARLSGTTPCTTYTVSLGTTPSVPLRDRSDPGNALPPTTWTFTTECLPTVDLLAPNGGEDWTGGSVHTIRWTADDRDDPVLLADLAYSADGGATYGGAITAGLAVGSGEGTYVWTLPTLDSTSVRVRITVRDAAGDTASDASATSFTIDSTPPAILVSFPSDGGSGHKTTRDIYFVFSERVDRASFTAGFNLTPNPGGLQLTWSVTNVGTGLADMLTVAHAPFRSKTDYVASFETSARDDSDPGNHPGARLFVRFATSPPPNVNPPVAKAVGKSQVQEGEAVTLDGSQSTGSIVQYVWRINDNQDRFVAVLVGKTVPVAFREHGRYHVTLIVTDTSGQTDEDTIEIAVTSNPDGVIVLSGVILLSAALVAATEGGRAGLFSLVIFPLYVRRKKNEVLEHQTRGMILGYIMVHPGDSYTDIKRNLVLSNGTLTYHIIVLEREHLIRSQIRGPRKLFFPMGVRVPEDGGGLHEIQVRIFRAVQNVPGLAVKDLAGALGITSQHALYHVRALASQGFVRLERRGVTLRAYAEEGKALAMHESSDEA